MRMVKSPGCGDLKREYLQELVVLSRKCADRAHVEWLEDKAAEAERLHEVAVSLGHGGSLLKDLKLLRCRQKLKADATLFAQDGSELNSMADKFQRWREHFAEVSSVSVELEEGVVSAVSK